LSQHIQQEINSIPNDQNVTILLDNKTLVTRIKKLSQKIYPNACLLQDFETIYSITKQLQQIKNCTVQHNVGTKIINNNSEAKHEITICKQLLQQTATLQIPINPITSIHNQACKLVINNIHINSKYLLALRTAAAKPTLWKFYEHKYNWDEACINSISWEAHGSALATLPQRQQKVTTQFIHKWLPTNASHSVQAEGSGRLCPYCNSDEETHQHYLNCNHPNARLQWSQTIQQITTKITKYNKNIDNTQIKLITLGLMEWRTTANPERPHFVQSMYHQLFQEQSAIGWNHLINGRFSELWTQLQSQINNKVPTTWTRYIIKTIWHHIHQIWKHRCSTNHGITLDDKRQQALMRLKPKINALYNKQTKIDTNDNHIFEKTQEEILLLPINVIERWL
jgi:hypothetical protein